MTSGLRRRATMPRDQPETPFAEILQGLVGRVAGARAAALVDAEGETVDYAGEREPYTVRVAAAHWRIVLDDVRKQTSLADTLSFAIRTERVSFVVHSLPEGYAIVLLLVAQARLVGWARPLAVCTRLLAEEAGWRIALRPAWFVVDVASDASGRPTALRFGETTEILEVLGRCADALGWRERAWRIRARAGVEATIAREPGGFWYADEPLDDLIHPAPQERLQNQISKRR